MAVNYADVFFGLSSQLHAESGEQFNAADEAVPAILAACRVSHGVLRGLVFGGDRTALGREK